MMAYKKIVIAGLFLLMSTCLFANSALAASWYKCTVKQIVPKANGSVDLHLNAGTGETRFLTTTGRAYLDADAAGTNKMLATVLTATSMDAELNIYLDTAPTWDLNQQVAGLSFVVPVP